LRKQKAGFRSEKRWLEATRGKTFHHKKHAADSHLVEKLADIVEKSSLYGVTGGFVGQWKKAVAQVPGYGLAHNSKTDKFHCLPL